MAGRKRDAMTRLLAALEDGPGTVFELADEARLAVPTCRALLGQLCRDGVLRRVGTVKRPVVTERRTALYAVPGEG